jgi:DNA-binding NtrC family response regulator
MSKDYEPKLLIVEDEPELALTLKETLHPICPDIQLASNGIEALKIIRTQPDLTAILSDIKMPQMTGLQLLAELRSQFNPIPFVVLSGHGDTDAYQEALRLNATDFLQKPFKIEELMDVMEKALSYGIELLKIQEEIDEFTNDAALSPERVALLRRLKRTAMSMKAQNSVYLRKSNG